MAFIHAIRWATVKHYSHVHFRGDCLTIIQKALSFDSNRSDISHTVDLAKDLLLVFDVPLVHFVRRVINKPAHSLAASSYFLSGFTELFETILQDVSLALQADISLL